MIDSAFNLEELTCLSVSQQQWESCVLRSFAALRGLLASELLKMSEASRKAVGDFERELYAANQIRR